MFKNFVVPVFIIILGFILSIIMNIKFLGYVGLIVAIVYLVYRAMPNIYIIRANRAYAMAKNDRCLEILEKLYQKNRMKPQMKVYYGYLALRCGKPDKAERLFQSALSSGADETSRMQAKSNMALVLWKRKQLPEAIALMEEVFETYKNTAIYGSLGYFYILSGDLDKALEFNKEAYEYNSNDNVIMDNLGQIYYLKNDMEKATEMYEMLMERRPEFPVPYYNYALVKLEQGDKEGAIALMRQALTFRFTYIAGVNEDRIRAHLEMLETEES